MSPVTAMQNSIDRDNRELLEKGNWSGDFWRKQNSIGGRWNLPRAGVQSKLTFYHDKWNLVVIGNRVY